MITLDSKHVSDDVRRLNPEYFSDKKKPATKSITSESSGEQEFRFLYGIVDGEPLEPEHVFDDTRNWRFDFAHLETKIAVEIDGGIWTDGRHTRGGGYIEDCIKLNRATAAGWRVFRFPAHLLSLSDAEMVAEAIEEALST